MNIRLFLSVALPLSFAAVCASAAGAVRPSLVVVISIDQLRGDFLPRFQEHFVEGGFNLLLEKGAVFADCHHKHSQTKTGPGHAVMLSGVHPDVHGIIGNDWLDYATLERVYCVGDPSVQIVGLPPSSAARLPGINDPFLGRSPANLLVTTVGDELKISRGGRPKVIGVAKKDRAAILMSGKLADAAYFMEKGRMISSTYYMPELPEWVEQWNAARKVEAYFGKVWDRLLPEAAYDVQGPDDAEGEDATTGNLGRIFPKIVNGGESSPGNGFYSAFDNTPFANEVMTDFARAVITEENLGGRAGVTDILCLGYSANDSIGHLWGPDSHEVMDATVRTDRILKELFQFLDERIGLEKCLIVLTADHGVSPMPERIQALGSGIAAGRIDGSKVLAVAEDAMNEAFGPLAGDDRWMVRDDQSLLLFPSALEEKNLQPAAAQAVVRDALLKLDFVHAAYTRDDLENGRVSDDLGRQMLLSFNRARSADVIYQSKPFYFSRATGSNHGSPYNYDTHVPLIFFGTGVTAGVHTERVGVSDLAPTLAHLLGIEAPPFARGRVLFDVSR